MEKGSEATDSILQTIEWDERELSVGGDLKAFKVSSSKFQVGGLRVNITRISNDCGEKCSKFK